MEVNETAACGISQREFAIIFGSDELTEMYHILRYALSGVGFYNEDFLEDLKSQLMYIIGPAVEESFKEDYEPEMAWEDTGFEYTLSFKEEDAGVLYQLLGAVDHPGEEIHIKLNRKLLEQMMEMASTILDNLPIINR